MSSVNCLYTCSAMEWVLINNNENEKNAITQDHCAHRVINQNKRMRQTLFKAKNELSKKRDKSAKEYIQAVQ